MNRVRGSFPLHYNVSPMCLLTEIIIYIEELVICQLFAGLTHGSHTFVMLSQHELNVVALALPV